jgi:bacillolysin
MKKYLPLVVALGLIGSAASGQQAQRIAPGGAGMFPQSLQFETGREPAFVPGAVLISDKGSYRLSKETILRHKEADAIGLEHFRYQQVMNGIPVEGATYVVHVADGRIRSQNGEWVADQPSGIATSAAISESAALQTAMNAFGARSYKWQIAEEEAFIKTESGDANASFKPKGELVYYSGETAVDAAKLRLAYKLDLYAQNPVGRRIYFIDAETGEVLGVREVMHTVNATGTANTAFSGTRNIIADSYNGSYRLRETGRGSGIQTFNLQKSTSYAAAVDFIDSDNIWSNVNASLDQYATDAHWGAEMTYDYFKNTFNRNSINNAGFAIKSYVHYSTNYFNAFWDGTRMTYGDGSSLDNYQPLTALDVCGHEITHGLTSFTANLNYSYESGALNEGFSDIFGTVIEFFAKPAAANWTIGENFYTIRSMSNPNAAGQPDTYQGTNWATGTADNGGVHTNSGVLNFWFYLLCQGGSGVNDKGTSYSVNGITMSKAAAIAYRTLTVYLTSTSDYAAARSWSVQSATDLYGASSNEVAQVINAWAAVGVGGAVTAPTCGDSYEANETRAAAKSIPVNTSIVARIGSSSDKDWFSFTTTAAAPKLKLSLTNLAGDYDLRLYNSAGTQLGISQNGGTTAESITYNSATGAATYYVQVYGYNGAYNATSCYNLFAATGSVNQLADEAASGNQGLMKPLDAASTAMLELFPNPAQGQLSLRFNTAAAATANAVVTDITGRVVLNNSVNVQEGANIYKLPLQGLAPGIYILKLDGFAAQRFQVIQ